jgi:hypothetical protein
MIKMLKKILILTFVGVLLLPQSSVLGETSISERFNNDNWYTLPHPRVATFSVSEDGSVVGFTENGISFVQYNVPNVYGIRVQRFEIQDHYHYIVDGEIADTFTELSQLLALAYERTFAV